MSMLETYRGIAYQDHMEHMNVKWYAAKFDEATWQLFSMIGVPENLVRYHLESRKKV